MFPNWNFVSGHKTKHAGVRPCYQFIIILYYDSVRFLISLACVFINSFIISGGGRQKQWKHSTVLIQTNICGAQTYYLPKRNRMGVTIRWVMKITTPTTRLSHACSPGVFILHAINTTYSYAQLNEWACCCFLGRGVGWSVPKIHCMSPSGMFHGHFLCSLPRWDICQTSLDISQTFFSEHSANKWAFWLGGWWALFGSNQLLILTRALCMNKF